MSNAPAKRPSTARKTTRKTEDKRRADLQQEIAFRVDGTTYTLRMGDLNSFDLMALRRETGMTLADIGEALESGEIAFEFVAVLVWLARRSRGEQMLKFQTVAVEINLESDIEGVDPDEGEDEGSAGEA